MKFTTLHAHLTRLCATLLTCGMILGLATPAKATVWTILDQNSSMDIDTGSQAGAFNWFVDGTDQLYQQWFWYRTGASTSESSIDTLPIGVQGTTDNNFDGDDDTLFVQYNGGGFNIQLTVGLAGGALGSGGSSLAETISVNNTTANPLTFTFFQYADFDLNGLGGSDVATFLNANTVSQTAPGVSMSEQVESSITPVPSHREISLFPNTLNSLNDGGLTTLSDTPGNNVPFGPGDVTWAYQWDVIIPGGGSFQISKALSMQVVPEPSTWALMGMGLVALVAKARRFRRK